MIPRATYCSQCTTAKDVANEYAGQGLNVGVLELDELPYDSVKQVLIKKTKQRTVP